MYTNIKPHLDGRWPPNQSVLFVAARENDCRSLGPGTRAVVWLQGCCFRCPGCVAKETLPFRGGSPTPIDVLADELVSLHGIQGITFSGGEPFMQARALTALIDRIRPRRDLSFMSYTGFTLDELRRKGEPDQLNLLSRLDLLIDGRYRREQHVTLRWRGSANQKVHFLSDRYVHLRSTVDQTVVTIDINIGADGRFGWVGIPPEGFRRQIEQSMRNKGIAI